MALSFSVLKIRDFRLLLLTRVFVMLSLQAQAVVVGWQVYSLTKDPFMLGLIGLTEAVPALICALFAGHIVDNGRPHSIYVKCLSVLALNSFGLLLFAGGLVEVEKGHLLLFIFGSIFISGVVRSFAMPASSPLLSKIVPTAKIPQASAMLTSGFQLAAISGPAIAGLIYGGYGVTVAWILPPAFMAIAVVMLASMSKHPKNYRSTEKREKALKSIIEGWKFMLHNRVLLSVMALDMFAVLFGGAVAMLPVVADQILHVGSEGLGLLRASPAIGSIIMALTLALYPMKNIRGKTLMAAIAGFGVCMIGFGLSKVFWLSMLFLALSGAFDSISMVIRGTLVQLLTPDRMRGRVSSVNSMFIISSNEIGAFESGLAARLMGLVPSIVFGGCATLFVVASTFFLSPKLRKTVVNTEEK